MPGRFQMRLTIPQGWPMVSVGPGHPIPPFSTTVFEVELLEILWRVLPDDGVNVLSGSPDSVDANIFILQNGVVTCIL